MEAQNARIQAARTNTQNAMSYVQTADGFMASMNQMLTRMSELTAMAKDVTKNTQDVALYDAEFQALKQQLTDTIGDGVTSPLGTFNGISLFGANASGLVVTIGESPDHTMTINEINLRAPAGSVGLLIASGTDVTNAGSLVVDAIQQIATERATLGAAQSRLEVAAAQLQVQFENLEAAISRIRDVDVAEEATALAKSQILVQSGTAMLAQANANPQTVLRLLQ
jgi:flagellin